MEEAEKQKTPYEKFKEKPLVNFGTRSINLEGMPPFTVGQKKRLEKKYGIKFARMQENAEDEAKLLHFILSEMDKEVTLEEMDDIPIVLGQWVMQFTAERAGEVDRPFSMRSMSSPAPTGGAA